MISVWQSVMVFLLAVDATAHASGMHKGETHWKHKNSSSTYVQRNLDSLLFGSIFSLLLGCGFLWKFLLTQLWNWNLTRDFLYTLNIIIKLRIFIQFMGNSKLI